MEIFKNINLAMIPYQSKATLGIILHWMKQ